MKEFPEISVVSHPATSKDRRLGWFTERQDAFVMLNVELTSASVLYLPDFKAPFIVQTDNSFIAIGGVLLINQSDGKIHLVSTRVEKLKRRKVIMKDTSVIHTRWLSPFKS